MTGWEADFKGHPLGPLGNSDPICLLAPEERYAASGVLVVIGLVMVVLAVREVRPTRSQDSQGGRPNESSQPGSTVSRLRAAWDPDVLNFYGSWTLAICALIAAGFVDEVGEKIAIIAIIFSQLILDTARHELTAWRARQEGATPTARSTPEPHMDSDSPGGPYS